MPSPGNNAAAAADAIPVVKPAQPKPPPIAPPSPPELQRPIRPAVPVVPAPLQSDGPLSQLYKKTDDEKFYQLLTSPEVQDVEQTTAADISALQEYANKYAGRLLFDYNGGAPSPASAADFFKTRYETALKANEKSGGGLAPHVEALSQAVYLLQLGGRRTSAYAAGAVSDRVREECLRITACVACKREEARELRWGRTDDRAGAENALLESGHKSVGKRAFFDRCLSYSWDLRLARLKVLHEVLRLSTRDAHGGGQALKAFCDDFLRDVCSAVPARSPAGDAQTSGSPNLLPLMLHLLLRTKAIYVASLTDSGPLSLPLVDSLSPSFPPSNSYLLHRKATASLLECQTMMSIANTLMYLNTGPVSVVPVGRGALREILGILNDCDFFAGDQGLLPVTGPSLRSLSSSLMAHCILPRYITIKDERTITAQYPLMSSCKPNDSGAQEALKELVKILGMLVPNEIFEVMKLHKSEIREKNRGREEGLSIFAPDDKCCPPCYSQYQWGSFGSRFVGVMAFCSLLHLFSEEFPDHHLFQAVFPHDDIRFIFEGAQGLHFFTVFRSDIERLNPRADSFSSVSFPVALQSTYARSSVPSPLPDISSLSAMLTLSITILRVLDKPTIRHVALQRAFTPPELTPGLLSLLVPIVEVVFLNQPVFVEGFWKRATSKRRGVDPMVRLLIASDRNCDGDYSLYFRLLASFVSSPDTGAKEVSEYDSKLTEKLEKLLDRALAPFPQNALVTQQQASLPEYSPAPLLFAIARIYSLSPHCDIPKDPIKTCRQLYAIAANAAASNKMDVCCAALGALAALSGKPARIQLSDGPALDWDSWPLSAASCISGGGGWGFLHSGSQVIVAAGLRLFGSLAAASLALAEASDFNRGVSGCAPLLLCLRDGAEAVCDVLSRSGEMWHYRTRIDRWELESACLRCLTALLTSASILSSSVLSSDGVGGSAVREAAAVVKERLLHRLSSDVLLGEAIGGCATLAVSSALRGSAAFKADLDAEDNSDDQGLWRSECADANFSEVSALIYGGRKPLLRDLNLNHGVLGTCESTEKDFIVKLAEDAMDLILAWFDAAREEGLERSPAPALCAPPKAAPECLIHLEGGEENSLVAAGVNMPSNRAMVASGFGGGIVPATLLSRTTTLNLISVYAGPRKGPPHFEVDVGDALALSSLEVIRRCMVYETSPSFVEALDGGGQLAPAMSKFLRPAASDVADVETCLKADLALASLALLKDAVTRQPVLASTIIQNMDFAKALVECLHCKSGWVTLECPAERDVELGFSLHPSLVAARASDCVALLWESCRLGEQPAKVPGGGRKNRAALDEAKQYLRKLAFVPSSEGLGTKSLSFFEALATPFSEENALKKAINEMDIQNLTMMQVSEYCARLQLLSSALRTVSIEIHGFGPRMGGGNSADAIIAAQLTAFLENAAKRLTSGTGKSITHYTKYDLWTYQFMAFDGRSLDELKEGGGEEFSDPRNAFARAGKPNLMLRGEANGGGLVFPDQTNFIFGPSAFCVKDSTDGFDMELFDLKRALAVTASIRGGGSKSDVVKALERHNAVRDLASSQANLIKSWKRFMEVSVLSQPIATQQAQPSPGGGKNTAPVKLPGSPAGGEGSNFIGDIRSMKMVLHTIKALKCVSEQSGGGVDSSEIAAARGGRGFGEDDEDESYARLESSSSSPSTSGIGSYALRSVASDLAEILSSMLHHQLHEVTNDKTVIPSKIETVPREKSKLVKKTGVELLASMLCDVQIASSRLFKATLPSFEWNDMSEGLRSQALDLGCKLRLRLLTSATMLAAALKLSQKESEDHLSLNYLKLSFDVQQSKLKLVGLAFDTLNLLKMRRPGGAGFGFEGSMSLHYWYTFGDNAGGGGSTTDTPEHRAVELLQVCVSLLSELLPTDVESEKNYAQMYATALRGSRGVPTLLAHLEEASAFAANDLRGSWEGGSAGVSDAMAFSERLMTFFFSAATCPKIGTVLSEDAIHRAFCENSLLQKGRELWSGLSSDGGTGRALLDRGYDSVYNDYPDREKKTGIDPVHEVWLLSLRTVSALLRTEEECLNSGFDRDGKRALVERTVDYMCCYCDLMISGLTSPRAKSAERAGSKKYTLQALKEMTFIAELLSEVNNVSGAAARFRCAAPMESAMLLSITKDEMKDICSFLGNLTLARYHMCSNQRRLSFKDSWYQANKGVGGGQHYGEKDTRAKHDASKAFRTLFGEMAKERSSEEWDLEKKKRKSESRLSVGGEGGGAAEDVDSGFKEEMTERTFIKRVEDRAAMFLSYAVAYVLRCHPGYDSFVDFTPDEALSINLYSDDVVRLGSVVAIYEQEVGGGVGRRVDVNGMRKKVGEVIWKEEGGRKDSFAVKYFDGSPIETITGTSRIAGIQDDSARQNILVPKTLDWNGARGVGVLEMPFCLGHLLHVVQWVGTFLIDENWKRNDDAWRESGDMLTCDDAALLCERVMTLLAFEVILLEEKAPISDAEDAMDQEGGVMKGKKTQLGEKLWGAAEDCIDWTREFMDGIMAKAMGRTVEATWTMDSQRRTQENEKFKIELEALCAHMFDTFYVSKWPEKKGLAQKKTADPPFGERPYLQLLSRWTKRRRDPAMTEEKWQELPDEIDVLQLNPVEIREEMLCNDAYNFCFWNLRNVFSAADKFTSIKNKQTERSVLVSKTPRKPFFSPGAGAGAGTGTGKKN